MSNKEDQLAEEDNANPTSKLSYVELLSMCERYLRLINNNRLHMDNFHCTLKELIRRAESGYNTNVTFGTIINERHHGTNEPVRATLNILTKGNLG